jgi:hypothetical protein
MSQTRALLIEIARRIVNESASSNLSGEEENAPISRRGRQVPRFLLEPHDPRNVILCRKNYDPADNPLFFNPGGFTATRVLAIH